SRDWSSDVWSSDLGMLPRQDAFNRQVAGNEGCAPRMVVIGVTEQHDIQLPHSQRQQCRIHHRLAQIEATAEPGAGVVQQVMFFGLQQYRQALADIQHGYPQLTWQRSLVGW